MLDSKIGTQSVATILNSKDHKKTSLKLHEHSKKWLCTHQLNWQLTSTGYAYGKPFEIEAHIGVESLSLFSKY